MRVCLKCHASLGCEIDHLAHSMNSRLLPGMEPCGVCQDPLTHVACDCAAAQEIRAFNGALRAFGMAMRRKFIQNMDKGGWRDIDWGFALKRLNREVGELSEALVVGAFGPYEQQRVLDESADVANFALFIGSRAAAEENRHWSISRVSAHADAKTEAPQCGTFGLPMQHWCEKCAAVAAKEIAK